MGICLVRSSEERVDINQPIGIMIGRPNKPSMWDNMLQINVYDMHGNVLTNEFKQLGHVIRYPCLGTTGSICGPWWSTECSILQSTHW